MKIGIKRVKIVVGVPNDNVSDVRNAICELGAGVIGNYCFCSMTTKAIDTFIPREGVNPYM